MSKELEQAAGDYIVQLNGEDLEGGFNAAFNAFKAGAEWMKKQMCNDCPNRGNTHSYLQGYEDGKKSNEQKNKEL